MKKWIVLILLMACFGVKAQSGSAAGSDAERMRISAERTRLEAAFALEETACYKRFWVNNCLDELKVRSRDALADLRRQEIVLNDDARKAKATEQLQKTEDRSSPENLQQEADKRAQTVKDLEARIERDRQKNIEREALQAGEKAKLDAAAGRLKTSQDKAGERAARQTLEAEERKKYNQRLERARERQARYARDKASQTKAPAQALPAPR